MGEVLAYSPRSLKSFLMLCDISTIEGELERESCRLRSSVRANNCRSCSMMAWPQLSHDHVGSYITLSQAVARHDDFIFISGGSNDAPLHPIDT